MQIVADPNIPFVREAFGPLGKIVFAPGRQIDSSIVRDADLLLVRSVTPVNAALLDSSRVKFVATATIGTDHVDLDYLRSRGIGFSSAAGSNANSVAEYVVAAMLEVANRRKFRLRDKTLGVIGVGNVGTRVGRYAEALGMRVLRNDPPRARAERLTDFVPIEGVLSEADIITLHVPLTKEGAYATYHMVAKDALASLEDRRPILLNTSRGAVVDNKALLKAIDGERLGGVVLDVWENEPNISPELLDVVDLGTPHIAGYSLDGKVNGVAMIHKAACRFFGIAAGWQPTLPPPVEQYVKARFNQGDDDEDVLRGVIQHSYNILADDAALREDVRRFDQLRADYNVRREFFNMSLMLAGASEQLHRKFTALGFTLG